MKKHNINCYDPPVSFIAFVRSSDFKLLFRAIWSLCPVARMSMAARKSTATKIKLCRALMSVAGITLPPTKIKLWKMFWDFILFLVMLRQIKEIYGKNNTFSTKFNYISTICESYKRIKTHISCNKKVYTNISLPAVNMSMMSIRSVITSNKTLSKLTNAVKV